MASLPPISATTRLIQSWPLGVLAASSLIWRPTSREPVNEIKRVFGCETRVSPMAAPLPTKNEKLCGGKPASSKTSANLAAIVGVSLDGLMTTVLPDDERRRRHAGHDGQRKIPRRNNDADAERQYRPSHRVRPRAEPRARDWRASSPDAHSTRRNRSPRQTSASASAHVLPASKTSQASNSYLRSRMISAARNRCSARSSIGTCDQTGK